MAAEYLRFHKRPGVWSLGQAWRGLLLPVVLALLAPLADVTYAQDKAVWTARPLRVEEGPRLDGVLDEPMWKNVEPFSDFFQREPADRELPTEKTEVWVCYDSRNLYFGIRAWDSDPEKLVRNVYERDGRLLNEDSVLIAIDSNHDHRTAYMFEMNTRGARTDIELSENSGFNINWDPIWRYAVRVDDKGYTLEAAIPFFVLRFQEVDELEMGLFLRRRIQRKNEELFWPYFSRDFRFSAVSKYGHLVGIKDIVRGKNLELKPYGIAGYSLSEDSEDFETDAGLDVKWGVTPGFTADLTVNPDFAQVESDDLEVNLTRFSLFFPEKREFFQENAELFQFGLPASRRSSQTRINPWRADVFFSRRIGLQAGEEVPIIAGARGYGLLNNTNLGVLTMQTNQSGLAEGENFSVVRVKHNILGRSYFGGILTSRQGNQSLEDATLGGDFVVLLENNISFQGLLTKSNRSGTESGDWFGSIGARQSTDSHNWEVRYDDIGEQFSPGIGFIQRRDQRTVTLFGERTPRPLWEGVRQLNFGGIFRRVENHQGLLETRSVEAVAGILFHSQDSIEFRYEDTFDSVPVEFSLAPDVSVEAGEYTNRLAILELRTSGSRKVSSSAALQAGSFYDGELKRANLSVQVRPVSQLHFDAETLLNSVDLPSGGFTTTIGRLFTSYFMSPDVSLRLATQYSSQQEDFILNFRFRWIYAPGSELWLVYNEGRRLDGSRDSLKDRAAIVKLVHNFNF